jgi:hypothetical protein
VVSGVFIALALLVLFKAGSAAFHADISKASIRYTLMVPLTLGMIPGWVGEAAVWVLQIPVNVLILAFHLFFGV